MPKGKIMSQFPGTKEIAEGNIVLDCCLLEPNRGGILHRFSSRNFPSNVLTERILTLRELKKILPSYSSAPCSHTKESNQNEQVNIV